MTSPADSVRSEELRFAASVAGPIVVFVCAWATSSVRGDLGTANIALILAIVTVVVALTSWIGGLITSTVAALSLNFFHTDPVHTLRIEDASDLAAVVLLGFLGVGVSILTALRVRTATIDSGRMRAIDATDELHTIAMDDRPVAELWARAIVAVADQLGLVDARVEPVGSSERPVVSRRRWSDGETDHTLVLPEGGAVVAFVDPRHSLQVVLTPRAGMGSLTLDRRAVFAFVDQLGLALAADT